MEKKNLLALTTLTKELNYLLPNKKVLEQWNRDQNTCLHQNVVGKQKYTLQNDGPHDIIKQN